MGQLDVPDTLSWVDEERVMMESLQGLKRGGANSIITYFAETILAKGLAR